MTKTGILLSNTGTPDAPTPSAVRRYLREFLSDKHIVKLPRLIWLPILYGLILTTRPQKSAALYKKIWTPQGSPMRSAMQNIGAMLQNQTSLAVELGMNYGHPSIPQGLSKLIESGAEHIIVLPLFPQFSNSTTASTIDRVNTAIQNQSKSLPVSFIKHYYNDAGYIDALAASIQDFWTQKGKGEHLLISFHGIPKRFANADDPYAGQCEETARLLAETLNLSKEEWTLCYQSKFGYDKWLEPSTQALLTSLPQKGTKSIDIICPGFPVDCLETLEEIAITSKEAFLNAGGQSLRYIPALNDSEVQVKMLAHLVEHS